MWASLLPTAILVPSLNRGHRLEEVVDNISDHTRPAHKIVLCVGDQESLDAADYLGFEQGYDLIDDAACDDKRYVTRMNKLVEFVRTQYPETRTVFFGSDDVYHHHGWLENALEVMIGPDQPSVVVVNDMRNPSGTQALVKMSYLDHAVFDAPGLAFHPEYRHQFADTEQFATALAQGAYARAMASCVEHLHPVFNAPNSLPDDKTYQDAQSWRTWLHDTELWKKRQVRIARHFDLEVQT